MEWKKEWEGKKVFVRLKSKFYTGKIINIDDSDRLMVFFTMIDKYGEKVLFLHSEILEIKTEGDNGKDYKN